MEAWNDLLVELSTKIREKLPEIKWLDLWRNQLASLTDKPPFPTPALFLSFKTLGCNDKGLLIQDCNTQVDMYVFYETVNNASLDPNIQTADLEIFKMLTKIHKVFHGKSGINHGILRRVGINREENSGIGCLYRISFECIVEDTSAQIDYPVKLVNDISIERVINEKPIIIDDNPLFVL